MGDAGGRAPGSAQGRVVQKTWKIERMINSVDNLLYHQKVY
jgi:hypothetical protein